jgi:hypothetical protein
LKGIKGGSDGGGNGSTTSEAWSGQREERGTVEKMKLASGAHVSAVDREKAPRTEGMNQRRKHIFANTPTARGSRAAWAGKVGFGLQEERGQRGRLGRRPSGPVSVAVPKVKKKDF